MEKTAINPFYFGRAVREISFTDRETETQRLVSNFKNGINTLLLSPRRWGKSSLVYKAGIKAKSSTLKVAFFDAFSVRSEEEFYNAYAKAVLAVISSKLDERLRILKQFMRKIVPTITMGVGNENAFSLGFDWKEAKKNADEILNFPNKIAEATGIKIVVCIDEFQNIACFGDSLAFQKLLRSVWQKHEHACYCLYGSKFHMMQELFERQSMPFYRFGDLIHLDKITEKNWSKFIKERFAKTGKSISNALVSRIINAVDRHSYYVQQLSHLIWERTKRTANEQIFDSALNDMIHQNALLYQRDTENMSATQLNFLKAVAAGHTQKLSSADIMREYGLGTSANVTKVKKHLLNDEIIDIKNKEVSFIDPVYALWFKQEILK
ncbi:ATPase [Bacteroidia bacterium]|nr:ATPase [Bacteroidia bacterium]GHT82081.1 ATPase [Bacteroidia bacterium]